MRLNLILSYYYFTVLPLLNTIYVRISRIRYFNNQNFVNYVEPTKAKYLLPGIKNRNSLKKLEKS